MLSDPHNPCVRATPGWALLLGCMRHIPCFLILGCFAAALLQWFMLLIIFMNLLTVGHKIGFAPRMVSVGGSGLFVFFVASAGLTSLCFVSRRGLPLDSLWRAVATAVICVLTGGAILLALALCTPYIEIADR